MNKSAKKSSQPVGETNHVNGITQQPRSTGKTAKEIVSKHVHDKNDVITEDDFKNLNIDLDTSNDTSQPPLEISNDPERPKDEEKDPKIITPWDIISE
jgi:hypothetical protein